MIDINTLTLGEIAKIEELAAASISTFGDEDTPKGKMLAALVFVNKKREDPSYTWTKALELTMAEATEALGLDTDEDPKEVA